MRQSNYQGALQQPLGSAGSPVMFLPGIGCGYNYLVCYRPVARWYWRCGVQPYSFFRGKFNSLAGLTGQHIIN